MILFASGTQWAEMTGTELRRVERYPVLRTPATVVWHPDDCTIGIASFEGDARHSAVLVERRLRLEGAVEAETKIFIHHVERVGQTYQALYSSASLDEWHRMQAWVAAQSKHCPWTSLCALAWSRVDTRTAVVLQVGNAFIFMGRTGSRIAQANTLAFGDDADSVVYAARTLGDRIRGELTRNPGAPGSASPTVEWLCANEPCATAVHAETTRAFEEASGLHVVSADTLLTRIVGDDPATAGQATTRTALPGLADVLPARLLLNTPRERMLLLAERHRAVALGAAIVMSCVFLGTAAQKAFEVRRIAAASQALQQRIAAVDRQEPPSAEPAADATYVQQLAFIDTVTRLQSGLDVVEILTALRSASGADVRILSVRAEELQPEREARTRGVLVDGVFQDGRSSQDSATLSSFVRTLATLGYAAEPVETRAAAAASTVSSQLFTYRLTRRDERSRKGVTP